MTARMYGGPNGPRTIRLYNVQVDAEPEIVQVPATHAVDAARAVADRREFGETIYEGATAFGRWTIATDDEHNVQAWPVE